MLAAYVLILGHSIVPHEHTALFDKDGHHHQHEHRHDNHHHDHDEENQNESDPLGSLFGHFPHSHHVHTQEHVISAPEENCAPKLSKFVVENFIASIPVISTYYDPPELPRPPELSTLDFPWMYACRRGPPAC